MTLTALATASGVAAFEPRRGPLLGLVVGSLPYLIIWVLDAGDRRRRSLPVAMALIAVVATTVTWRAATEHTALERVEVGLYRGWVTLVGSPVRSAGGSRQIVSVEGRRFETWVTTDGVLAEAIAGPGRRFFVLGETRMIDGESGRRRQMSHVVGRLIVHRVIEAGAGSPLDRWRVGIRGLIAAGAEHIAEEHRSLFLGLVIGDRDQPDQRVTDRFRASGLAHLNVASGLNVTLLLVTVAPILTRMRPLARWMTTVLVVAWFADLVGSEPSILRASVMAVIAATAFLGGQRWRTIDVVLSATIVLIVLDPFLVHLAGFWMSIGATAGVVVLGPPIARRLAGPSGRPGRIVTAMSVTLGAQAGVALPLVATTGSVPLVSIPANLVAVPLGSVVKAVGLPAAIVSGAVPTAGPLLMPPVGALVGAVDRIAAVAAGLEPEGPWVVIGWTIVVVVVVIGRRSWPRRDT